MEGVRVSAIVERVAGAIANAWPDRDIPHENAAAMARAAIAAIREPTQKMVEDGRDAISYREGETYTQLIRDAWDSMIDAALKEP